MCHLLAIPSEPLFSQSPNHVVVDGFMPNQRMMPIHRITNIGFGSWPLCRPGLRHFSCNSAFRELKIFSATTSEGQDPWKHCQFSDTYLLCGNTSRSINCSLAQLLGGGFMAFDTVSHIPKSHILSGPPGVCVYGLLVRHLSSVSFNPS
jgi:hypothetical protein